MTPKEIVEKNKIIAEFMGGILHTNGSSGEWFKFDGGIAHDTSDLKYHSSWDWLMPVVEKIEQITLKEIIGVAASKPYWENDTLRVAIGYRTTSKHLITKEATDFPICFTINGKQSWIQYYSTSIYGGDAHFELIKVSATSKIESAYLAVVEFITQYNEHLINQKIEK